jgi:glycosyltransferase involved in cell wall biosynthesis
MNAGIAAAGGDLIAVLDQDDVFAPRKIELQRRILRDHTDVGFVTAMCGRLDHPESRAHRTTIRRRAAALTRTMNAADGYYLCDGDTAFRLFVRHENFATGFPGFMFRRVLWETKGGLDERLAVASDYEFLCWMCTRADMAFVADIHYLRREHTANLSRHETRRLADVIAVLAKHVDACGEPRRQRQIRRALGDKLMRMALYFGIFRNWRDAYCLWDMTIRIDRSFGGVCRSIMRGLRLPHRALRHRRKSSEHRSSRHELQQTIETLHLLFTAAGILPPRNH